MARLSKQVREWVDVIGISPSAVAEALVEINRDIRDVVIDEVNNVIENNLSQGGRSHSLVGYQADYQRTDELKVNLGGETFGIPNYNVYVRAPDWHEGLPRPLNVFDLIDEGRPELPKRQAVYTVWSWRGRNQALNIPEGRGGSNIRRQLEGPNFSPSRPEPRSAQGPFISPPPRRLFTRGPLKAVPGRKLYSRIMSNIRRKLRQQGLPFDGVTFSRGS